MVQHLAPGATLKHYRIVGLLGKGGMGEVYAAEDTKLGRKVAIKTLPAALAGDPDRLRRFTQETKAASALNHPSILTIYDVDEVDGQPFLVSEFIEGQSLRDRLLGGEMPLREAIDIAGEVARALAAAHAAGIVHRDVKPENIMVRDDGHTKLVDFGLAKVAHEAASAGSDDRTIAGQTTPGVVLGTTHYMSPEQARGLNVDARSDIFSLGVVLYEMVAGRIPFEGATTSDVIAAILRIDPAAIADLPPEVDHTLRKALEKDREERYQTAKDLAADLKRLRRHLDPPARSSPPPAADAQSRTATSASAPGQLTSSVAKRLMESAARMPKRRRLLATAGAILIVAIVIFPLRAGLSRWLDGGSGAIGGGLASFSDLTVEQVGGLGAVQSPMISPDGRLLAYASREGAASSIWLRQMATGSVVRVVGPTPDGIANIQFSPDSDFLYFSESTPVRPIRYVLKRVPAFGGAAREILEARLWRVSFSPDGTRFVAMRDSITNWDLIVMNADGTGTPSVIAANPKSQWGFVSVVWSPSGNELAMIVFEQDPSGLRPAIQFMRPDGTRLRTVRPAGAPGLNEIAWTTNADSLLAVGGGTATAPNQLLLIRTADGHVDRVTNDTRDYSDLSYSTGSGAIATIQRTSVGSIWIGPAERPDDAQEVPGRLSEIDGGWGLSWLNNRELVFVRVAGGWNLWTMNVDGTGARRVTNDQDAVDLLPRASRDGRGVVFERARESAKLPEIYRWSPVDGRVTQITRENGASKGMLSPDGHTIFFKRTDETPPARLLSMPVAGGPVTTVFEASSIFDYALSPDGTRLAVIGNAGVGAPRTISLVPAAGGTPRTIFTTSDALTYVRWYPSGDALLLAIIRNRQSNLFRLDQLDVPDRPARQLTHVTRGVVGYGEISPDGRSIAYFKGTSEPNIVLLKPRSR